jgi:hypothetical protein
MVTRDKRGAPMDSMEMHCDQLSIKTSVRGSLVNSMTMHSEQLSIYNFGEG